MSSLSLDEAKRLRDRDDSLQDGLSRRNRTPSFGSPSLVVQTKAIETYPAAAQRFYACVAQTVLGVESEGGSGSFSPGPASFFALNLGTSIPPVGTYVVATFVESRWVFRYDG